MWFSKFLKCGVLPFAAGFSLRWFILGCPGIRSIVSYWMSSDALFLYGFLAVMREEKWLPFTSISSSRLGFPEHFVLGQWPMIDVLHFTQMHLLNLVINNPVVVYNLYYLVGAGLICLTMTWLCRSLDLPFSVALTAGLIYSALPFAMERLYHLFLASYFQVPLAFYVLLHFRKKIETWKLFGIGAVIGGTGAYFAFFSVTLVGIFFLILLVIERKNWKSLLTPLRNSVLTVGSLLSTMIICMIPTWIHIREHGNFGSTQRNANESLIWGGHIEDMFLPHWQHWFPPYAEIRPALFSWDYLKLRNDFEGNREYIGMIALVGIILTLIALFKLIRQKKVTDPRLLWLGASALWIFALSVTHGLGYLFAVAVTPSLRSWNRGGLFIATAGVLAFFIWISPHLKRFSPLKTWLICAGLLIFGLAEMGTIWKPVQPETASYESDRTFTHQIKQALGDGVVLTLPFGFFPEWKGYQSVETYAPVRYLTFDTVRSTHPAVKGSPLAQRQMERFFGRILRPDEILNYGLAGAVIDKKDFPDGGLAQIAALKHPDHLEITSPDGRFVFIKLKR